MNDAGALHVLVVEDDQDTRDNLCDILALDDYRVTAVGSIAEALEHRDWRRISAIVLDRRLPDGTAADFLPHLRKVAPDAPVIVVTGFPDVEGAIAALQLGAYDYILKPINPEALRASLARIAERKRLAEEKDRSEAAFRNLVEAAGCLIVILRLDGTVAYFNPFAQQITGYAMSQVLGHDYLERIVHDAEQQRVLEELERVQLGQASRGFESAIRTRDGSERWIAWNARRMDDYQGAPALLAVGIDVTERKQAQERMMQAERLAAIGQMVTGLAHESRNALQRSQSCLEMLSAEVESQPEALDLVHRIQKAQDQLHQLFDDVRGYAAPLTLERQTCDLAQIWRDTWAHLEVARKNKQITLHEAVDPDGAVCHADPFAIGQVLRNILENAIAACREPGKIVIRCRPSTVDGQPAVQLAIEDNGPGIPPRDRERVFEPFFTTKSKGTGLGMAIANRIVEAHGGRLVAGAAASGGAEFVMTLPKGAV